MDTFLSASRDKIDESSNIHVGLNIIVAKKTYLRHNVALYGVAPSLSDSNSDMPLNN